MTCQIEEVRLSTNSERVLLVVTIDHKMVRARFALCWTMSVAIFSYNYGCSSESSSPQKNLKTVVSEKSDHKVEVTEKSSSSDGTEIPKGALIDAKYRMSTVIRKDGAVFGECGPYSIPLKINNSFFGNDNDTPLFEVPNKTLDCQASVLKFQISPARLLGVFTDSSAKPKFKEMKNAIFVDRLGDGFYPEWRPLMPSFLNSTPEELAGLDLSISGLMLKTKLHDATDTGDIRLRTLSVGKSETVAAGTFPNVLSYETVITGYNNVKVVKIMNFLFDRTEWHISFSPFAFTMLKFDTTFTQLGKAATYNPGTVGGLAGSVLGWSKSTLENVEPVRKITESVTDQYDIEITMELEEQLGLNK